MRIKCPWCPELVDHKKMIAHKWANHRDKMMEIKQKADNTRRGGTPAVPSPVLREPDPIEVRLAPNAQLQTLAKGDKFMIGDSLYELGDIGAPARFDVFPVPVGRMVRMGGTTLVRKVL